MFNLEYPRWVYLEGRCRLVNSEDEYIEARLLGWTHGLVPSDNDPVVDLQPDDHETGSQDNTETSSYPEATALEFISEIDSGDSEFFPTIRETLERKARELGIKFNARTTNEVLSSRISAALAGGQDEPDETPVY